MHEIHSNRVPIICERKSQSMYDTGTVFVLVNSYHLEMCGALYDTSTQNIYIRIALLRTDELLAI